MTSHSTELIPAQAREFTPVFVSFHRQTGGKSSADLSGGVVSPYSPESLAAGATHVTWAKFKLEAGDLSGSKYAVNIESILNRPFEGLAPKSQ
jgi:hypothetical protein